MESKLKHFVLIMLIICFIVLLFLQIKLETQPTFSFFTNGISKFNRVAKLASIVTKKVNKSPTFESSKSTKTAKGSLKSTSISSIVRTVNGKLVVFTTPFDQTKIGTEIPKYDIILNFKVTAGLGNRMFQYASALGIAMSNNRNLKVYPVIPEMQANLNISSSWISNFSLSK